MINIVEEFNRISRENSILKGFSRVEIMEEKKRMLESWRDKMYGESEESLLYFY